jgi:lactaldehyde dehydrogenase/glycolaldehyde dehydrogenase
MLDLHGCAELKPTEIALLMRLIEEELGLPPGVLNVIATGQALTCNARTNMVTFTGHRDTGKRVMADDSANLTRVAFELGGKAPAIAWRDADIPMAVKALAAARFGNGGQICTCAERALVQESSKDVGLDRLRRHDHTAPRGPLQGFALNLMVRSTL